MAAPPIRIRVGAAVDTSVERTFLAIEARAQKMRAVIASGFRSSGTDMAKGAASAESAWVKGAERIRQSTKKIQDDSIKSFREIGKVAEREMNRAARAQFNANQRAGERFASRTSYYAARFLTPHAPLLSGARRVASDIARGVGVDFNVGGAVQRNVEREALAVKISNSGYLPGTEGPNAQRVSAAKIQAAAGESAKKFGLDPTEALQGLESFVKRTGDLDTALKVLPNVAKLAAASGTSLADMMQAAGATVPNLKGVSDKSGVLDEVLRNLIAQGKIGAVEMEDFAKEISKLAPQANRFAGGSAENLGQLAALAQLSIESGGATSAQQASTSVARLVDTLSTPARARAFKGLGIDVETTNAQGMKVLRDPFSVIKQALLKTNGDPVRLKALFASSIGARPTEALAGYYRAAGGGQAGIAAVEKKLAEFKGAKFSDANIASNLAEREKTTDFKAKQFQAKFDETVKQFQAKLLPALEKLEPEILSVTEAFGGLATWVSENLGMAIAAAVTYSIGRAGLESAFRAGIERLILGAEGGLGSRAAAAGGLAGGLGAGLTIASLAVTSLIVGTAIIDKLFDESQKKQKESVESDVAAFQLDQKIRSGSFAPGEAKQKAEELVESYRAQTAKDTDQATGLGRAAGDFLVGDVLGFFSKDIKEAIDSRRKIELERVERAAKSQANSEALLKNLNEKLAAGIKITNLPAPAGSDGRDTQK